MMGEEYIHWNVRGINDKIRRKEKVSKIISLLQRPQDKVLINNIFKMHVTFLATSNKQYIVRPEPMPSTV